MDLEDAEGGTTGDGAGVILSRHEQTNLFQRSSEIGTDAHIPPDVPGESPRRRSAAERRLPTSETMLAD